MCLSLSPSSPLLCLWKCTWKVGEIYSQLPTITGHAISYEISIQLWMQACYWPECLFKIWLIQLLTVHRANATKPKWKMYSSPWLASECIQLMVLAWNSVISSTCFPLWAWNTGCCIRRRLQVCVLAATRHLCVARHFSECPQQVHSRAPSPGQLVDSGMAADRPCWASLSPKFCLLRSNIPSILETIQKSLQGILKTFSVTLFGTCTMCRQ